MSLKIDDYKIYSDHLYEKARRDILSFTKLTKPEYRVNWHHRNLADKLNAFARGEIRFLMVFMPPRHGKSELVSRRFPAWLHGLYPDAEIMAASYLDSLAGDMTIDVQNIIDSKTYKEIFPETKIWPPGTSYTKGTRNSSEHHIIGRKGKYRGQGVGGSFTGKGANFCLVFDTKVFTESGKRNIDTIKVNDKVWSFNHDSGKMELKRVEAISRRFVPRLVQVETSSGNQIFCSPEHPFFIEERGYIEASSLTVGLGIRSIIQAKENGLYSTMHFLREGIRKTSLRLLEAVITGTRRLLLFEPMLSGSSQRKKQKTMRHLQNSYGEQRKNLLLARVQTKLEWFKSKIIFSILEKISNHKGPYTGARRIYVRCLQLSGKACRSSYRRNKIEQQSRELNNSLHDMSHEAPQGIEADTIRAVEEFSGSSFEVFDIRVEGNHNFFANNVLVSNCLIDDPIKGREVADSVAFRERLWNFWNNDLFTRLETNLESGRLGQAMLTQTRWHSDDLSGRLLDQMKSSSEAIQWEIINYPAIKVSEDDPTDTRKVGEALWPDKYDIPQLNQIKTSIGPRAWTSLYQQNPVEDGGGLFNEQMFSFEEIPTQFGWSFITADTAYKEKAENDFTVFSCWGVANDTLFLRDVFKRQMKSSDVESEVEPFIRRHLQYGYRGTWIEPKGHGIYLNQKWAQKGLMIPSATDIEEFYKDRRFDKVERANNVIPHLSSRRVVINQNISFKEDLLNEVLSFPKVKHDDFTDTLIDALKITYSRAQSMFDLV